MSFPLYTKRHDLYRGWKRRSRWCYGRQFFYFLQLSGMLRVPRFAGPQTAFSEGRRKYVPKRKQFPFGIRPPHCRSLYDICHGRYHINLIMALVAPSREYLGRVFYRYGPIANTLPATSIKQHPLGFSTGRLLCSAYEIR